MRTRRELGRKNNGATTKEFEGVADAPVIPSIQMAWNKDNWSLQFNFSVPGGGGACEFADGLGSCESVVGTIAQQLKPLGAEGYDMDGYMQGRQYYFGFQLGSAYKITDDLSVYGGLRLLYGTATYKARISNIQVMMADKSYIDFGSFLSNATATIDGGLSQVNAGLAQLEALGATSLPQYEALTAQKAQLEGTRQRVDQLEKYSRGVNLLCNQNSVGVAPVVGIDYRMGRLNFAAKYEFKTQIRMKNESTVFEASEIDAVNKFRDSEEVNEDQPALLTVGVQWNPLDPVRVNAGWHYFFDKDASWYGNSQRLLDYNTNEFLLGAEWDINDRMTISTGAQMTRYGLTDQYMNDMSFVVNSYSIGFGCNYKLNDVVTLKGAFFQTNYGHYDRTDYPSAGISDSFTRSNRVLGLGCDIQL